jgi:hypothetical protein
MRHQVEIVIQGKKLIGFIMGDCDVWDFHCKDRDFVKLFPDGVLHSFSMYGTSGIMWDYREYQQVVQKEVTAHNDCDDEAV